MAEVSDQDLSKLREAARLLAESVALDASDGATDEQRAEHAEALARWLGGAQPELDLARLKAEHAYLVGMAHPDDLKTMRKELGRKPGDSNGD